MERNKMALSFVSLLKESAKKKDLNQGSRIHADILHRGLLEENPYLGNTLASMYVKCGALVRAQHVIDELPVRDVFSWNILISGYTQQGQGQKAIDCFRRMRSEGVFPSAITYACILKACSATQDFVTGGKIHGEIASEGLLKKDIVLGTALLNMYAKCGMLVKAQEVLDELPVQDVYSWSALIAGYVQQGKGQEALGCFQLMQNAGFSPDSVTYVWILKACGIMKNVAMGQKIHDDIVRQGLMRKDVVLGTSLVDMYVLQGHGQNALGCFQRMQEDGVSPNAVTYSCVLNACSMLQDADMGKKIHDDIASRGLLREDTLLGNALVHMYAKCGALQKAQRVLDDLPSRDVVNWNSLISGYVRHCQGEEALGCFQQMQSEGVSPDEYTYACILKACGITQDADMGQKIHDDITSEGLLKDDVVLGSALIHMYVKCGLLHKAQNVHNELPFRNVISWNTLIAGYVEKYQGQKAIYCFQKMQSEGFYPTAITYSCILKACGTTQALTMGEKIHKEIESQGLLKKDIMLGNALVDMYSKCGILAKAHEVLDGLPVRNVVSWSALIAGYIQQGQGQEALGCFQKMQNEGISPDAITYACTLRACAITQDAAVGKRIHDDIVSQGLLKGNVALGNTLVDMYAKCHVVQEAQKVFDELTVRDVAAWSALIVGYVEQGEGHEALGFFHRMRSEHTSPDAITYSSVLKACGTTQDADVGRKIHHDIISQGLMAKDIVLITALIDMYVHLGMGQEALGCFQELQSKGSSPDVITYACILKACGVMQDADMGKRIHKDIASQGLLNKVVVGNALVDMYAKCGVLQKAQEVLDKLPVRDVVCWNTLIAGYAEQGLGQEALDCFQRMRREGVSPNRITYASIVKAMLAS